MSEDAEEEKDVTTVLQLACGNTVTFVRQVAKRMCKFSTRYVPCIDDEDLCRCSTTLPFDAKCGKIFGFPTTIDPGVFYIPRTYGKWWDQAPLGSKEDFMPQNNDLKVGHDFVDFIFEKEVYPRRVCIFEAFNPGCIIGIWAESFDKKLWHKLWSGPVEDCSATHRIFCPSIKTCNFKTKLLRFELSHSHLEYYTQLEGAFLMGTTELILPHGTCPNPNFDTLYYNIDDIKHGQLRENDRLSQEVLEDDLSKLKKMIESNWVLHKSANEDGASNIKLLSMTCRNESSTSANDTRDVFEILPDETLLKILKNLDLRSLCRFSQVNRRLNSVTQDSGLYTSLNLKSYWNLVDTAALKYLTPRCEYLQRLDMSWCGNYDDSMIQPDDMSKFINTCGKLLTNLRLNCCQFVDDNVVVTISSCKNLKELCLNNCRKITDDGFINLERLQSLERLELYRTKITTPSFCAIIERNPQMRHLNLAETSGLEMNLVANKIVDCCDNLESIDCWYSRNLSLDGLKTFSRCTNLREIDVGWCPAMYPAERRGSQNDSVRNFLSSCNSLEKIGLAAQRFLTNRDLEPLFANPRLQQLHLGGAAKITPNFFDSLLSKSSEIRMIDLSCYDNERRLKVSILQETYPGVSIKWKPCRQRCAHGFPDDDD